MIYPRIAARAATSRAAPAGRAAGSAAAAAPARAGARAGSSRRRWPRSSVGWAMVAEARADERRPFGVVEADEAELGAELPAEALQGRGDAQGDDRIAETAQRPLAAGALAQARAGPRRARRIALAAASNAAAARRRSLRRARRGRPPRAPTRELTPPIGSADYSSSR